MKTKRVKYLERMINRMEQLIIQIKEGRTWGDINHLKKKIEELKKVIKEETGGEQT